MIIEAAPCATTPPTHTHFGFLLPPGYLNAGHKRIAREPRNVGRGGGETPSTNKVFQSDRNLLDEQRLLETL